MGLNEAGIVGSSYKYGSDTIKYQANAARMGRVYAERTHAVFNFQVARPLSGYLKAQLPCSENGYSKLLRN